MAGSSSSTRTSPSSTDVEVRRAAFRRLQKVYAEIEAVAERRVTAWGELSQSASGATTAQVKALSERLAALRLEARALRACVVHGDRRLILERAQRDLRAARSMGF